jgi:hypothetical protein
MMQFLHNWNPLHILDRWLAMFRLGRGVRFVVPTATAVVQTMKILRQYGIKTYGFEYTADPSERAFRVRREQAQWAAYLLARADVPVLRGPQVTAKPGPMPRAWGVPAKPVGLLGHVVDFLSR